jgi:hypothetical protein
VNIVHGMFQVKSDHLGRDIVRWSARAESNA